MKRWKVVNFKHTGQGMEPEGLHDVHRDFEAMFAHNALTNVIFQSDTFVVRYWPPPLEYTQIAVLVEGVDSEL